MLFALKVNSQPIKELEKAYKKNSSKLLNRFITKYSVSGSNYCDDTCKNVSDIMQVISNQYVNHIKTPGKGVENIFTFHVSKKEVPANRYLIYNSNIKVEIAEFDLFRWNVKITEFDLYAGKKTYRDSTFQVSSQKKIILYKDEKTIPQLEVPSFADTISYRPLILSSAGINAINTFCQSGKIDKKANFLRTLIRDVEGVNLSGKRMWGYSIYFENILFNNALSQALIQVSNDSYITELYFEKYGSKWQFVERGMSMLVTN